MPAAAEVAQAVFTFAWHLSRCQCAAARLLLGMPAACVGELARHTLGQVRMLATQQLRCLRPRWSAHPDMWRLFLGAAATEDAAALERARLRGQTLLAAEARRPAPLSRARRVGPACAAEFVLAYAPGPESAAARRAGHARVSVFARSPSLAALVQGLRLPEDCRRIFGVKGPRHMKQALIVVDVQESFRSRPYFRAEGCRAFCAMCNR